MYTCIHTYLSIYVHTHSYIPMYIYPHTHSCRTSPRKSHDAFVALRDSFIVTLWITNSLWLFESRRFTRISHEWVTTESWRFKESRMRHTFLMKESRTINESRMRHASPHERITIHSSWNCHDSRVHIWDMTHSYMRHDSFIYETWLSHMCDMTRHHALIRNSVSYIESCTMYDMTHSYMRHDSVTCVTWLVTTHWYVIQSHI